MNKLFPAGFSIKQLYTEDWTLLKEIRLESLKHAQGLFGGSYEDAIHKTDFEWQETLNSLTNIFYALQNDQGTVGIAALMQNRDNDSEVFISAVYIKPEYRGMGLTHTLFQNLIDLARQKNYKHISCSTRHGNKAIISVCNKSGFVYSHTVYKLWPDNTHADLIYYRLDL